MATSVDRSTMTSDETDQDESTRTSTGAPADGDVKVSVQKSDSGQENHKDLLPSDSGDTPSSPTKKRRVFRRVGALALVLAAVLSAVFAGLAYREHHRLDADEQLRERYVATARSGIEALTTVNAKTVDADVAELLDMASGDFKTDFGGRSESYKQVVGDAQATSKGTVIDVGVEKMDDDTATLLVAAHAEVTNEGTTTPEMRDYRFRVVVTNGSPQTMSKVDFVV